MPPDPQPQNPLEGVLQGRKINPPAFIVFLIVLAGLLGSFEIYKLYISPKNQNNIQTTETQTTSLDTSTASTSLTASWKTYRNEEYGFEFKYPNLGQSPTEILLSTRILIDMGGSVSVQYGIFYNQDLNREMRVEELTDKSYEQILIDGKQGKKRGNNVYLQHDNDNIISIGANDSFDPNTFILILSTFKFIK